MIEYITPTANELYTFYAILTLSFILIVNSIIKNRKRKEEIRKYLESHKNCNITSTTWFNNEAPKETEILEVIEKINIDKKIRLQEEIQEELTNNKDINMKEVLNAIRIKRGEMNLL